MPRGPDAAEPSTGRRCAVLGSPIAHSLSPTLHRTAYAALGLDWSYDALEVTEESLAGFLDSLDARWRGLSLTMPLKRAVLPLLDEVSGEAQRAGAVNTVLLDGSRRVGHNTDISGALAALREKLGTRGLAGSALILGGGATAASAGLALVELGVDVVDLAVRTPSRAEGAAAAIRTHPRGPQVRVVPLHAIPSELVPAVLCSTIPAEAQDAAVRELVGRVQVVFDVVYHPWPTPLAAAAAAQRSPLVNGIDLLVHQAALQVTLMTGHTAVPLAEMRHAAFHALGAEMVP